MKTLSGYLPNIVKILRENFSLQLSLFGDIAMTRYHIFHKMITEIINISLSYFVPFPCCSLTMINSYETQHFMITQMHWITVINQYRSTSIDREIADLQMMLLQTTCDTGIKQWTLVISLAVLSLPHLVRSVTMLFKL